MKLSARNQIRGIIRSITVGAVNCEVLIEIPGGQTIVSIVTKSSVENLGLKEGMPAYAVMKASNVMIGVD